MHSTDVGLPQVLRAVPALMFYRLASV